MWQTYIAWRSASASSCYSFLLRTLSLPGVTKDSFRAQNTHTPCLPAVIFEQATNERFPQNPSASTIPGNPAAKLQPQERCSETRAGCRAPEWTQSIYSGVFYERPLKTAQVAQVTATSTGSATAGSIIRSTLHMGCPPECKISYLLFKLQKM